MTNSEIFKLAHKNTKEGFEKSIVGYREAFTNHLQKIYDKLALSEEDNMILSFARANGACLHDEIADAINVSLGDAYKKVAALVEKGFMLRQKRRALTYCFIR